MKLSIIVPAYNAARNISRCINSIIFQGVGDIQIIIVDDHSTDNTYLICKEFQKKYSNIEVYQTLGKGVSAARNTGLNYAQGDIIGFCDADDYYESGVFSIILGEFVCDLQIDICSFGMYYRECDGKITREICNLRQYLNTEEMFERVLCDIRVGGSVCDKFYKKEILTGVLFTNNLSYGEDIAFNAEILIKNKNVKCLVVNVCAYNYVMNIYSVMHDTTSMFNGNNELKAIESMHYVESIADTQFEKKCVKRAIFKMAVEYYFLAKSTQEQKRILRLEIRKGFFNYLLSFYKMDAFNNIKVIIKGGFIIIDNGTGFFVSGIEKILQYKHKNITSSKKT